MQGSGSELFSAGSLSPGRQKGQPCSQSIRTHCLHEIKAKIQANASLAWGSIGKITKSSLCRSCSQGMRETTSFKAQLAHGAVLGSDAHLQGCPALLSARPRPRNIPGQKMSPKEPPCGERWGEMDHPRGFPFSRRLVSQTLPAVWARLEIEGLIARGTRAPREAGEQTMQRRGPGCDSRAKGHGN